MSHHFHAVVWIDHEEARIFEFGTGGVAKHRVKAESKTGHVHHKAGTMGSGHVHADKHYLAAIAAALKPYHEVLIVGHGETKTELSHYIRDHEAALAPKIMGVEAIGNLTEGEVVAHARKFFEARDRMTPQR